MAEQFIEDLYWYSDIIFELEKIVLDIREHFDTTAVQQLDQTFSKLTELCSKCINDQLDQGRKLWTHIKKISEIEADLTSIGDVIDLEILPIIKDYVATLADISVDIDDDYSIHSSASGYLTLYFKQGQIYLNSQNDPMYEALLYVRSIYTPGKSIYYVFGCGLGYELYQLYTISDTFPRLVLYEQNDTVYNAALSYGVLQRIPEKSYERRIFKDADDFLASAADDDAGILINPSSVHSLQKSVERRKLTTYLMSQNTARLYDSRISENRIRNKMLDYPSSEKLLGYKCSEVVVVAAGPSLSERIDLLKKWKGHKIIISVGTVFRKLLSEGIEPDFVVIVDPSRNMTEQLVGIENTNIPLLLDENAYWKLARMYKGPVYFIDNANYGGTVSSAAIEIALRIATSKIYLIGLDLAYPVLKSHADGSSGTYDLNPSNLFPIESTDGGKVLTSTHLEYYIKVIEKQIVSHPDISFYNLSGHGAKISGTITYTD